MLHKFLLIFNICILSFSALVLATPDRDPCFFDSYKRQNKARIEIAESIISDFLKTENSFNSIFNHGVRTIPVVVHVIHNGGSENISDAQIISQIETLNEDFRKLTGTNGDGNGVDTEIEFCLAKISPNGHCTNGIVRVKSSLTNHFTFQRGLLKQLSYWDNTRYLNVYVVKSINGGSGIAGYSSFPGGPPDEDGVVILANSFGRVGTAAGSLGRTTTHEISHWFGLYHIFNGGCGVDTCSDGDYVCDTPPAENPNFGCPIINSCSNDFPDVNDQIQNYTDYSDDACKNMFTLGQKDRMHATLNTFRTHIWDQPNITSTGCDSVYISPTTCPPVAGFLALQTNICVGNSISFISNSLNSPDTLNWFFPGGTPSTSTDQNPIVTYDSTGIYPVTLIVSDFNGTDTIEVLNYISVSTPPRGSPNTWGDNFENINFPINGLTIDNPDGGVTWERTTDAANEGVASIRIQNLINTNYGQSDALILPRFDLTAFSLPIKLVFKWAYARSDPNYSDELMVLVSNDCWNSYARLFYRTGNLLATGPTQTSLFIPDSSQWKLATVDLIAYKNNDHVDIKIVNVTDGGNALYIDSLKIGNFDFSTLTSNVQNIYADNLVRIYPNPVGDHLQIELHENVGSTINELNVLNLVGQNVISIKHLNHITYELNTAELSPGIYFISIKIKDNISLYKFIKE